MKKLTTLLLAILIGFGLYAQKPAKEKDIIGEWQLVIDIDEDEILQGIEEDEDIPFFAEWIAESAVNLAFNIIDDLDIQMSFRENGRLKVVAEIFGEREVEYTEWSINKEGQVVIDDVDFFDGDDDVWLLEKGRLVSYEGGRRGRYRDHDVFLERIN